MTSNVRPAPTPAAGSRYPLVGGAAAWYLPVVAAVLAAGALAFGALEVAVAAAALGWVAYRFTRSVVLEISPIGLTRGFLGPGAFRARTTVIPWGAVVEVRTTWCRPGDDFALETAVRDHEGRAIRLSTLMGLAAYWTCLAEIVRRAPAADRSGITDAVLAEARPGRHHVVSALGTVTGLALVLAAVVTVHYLWAQGRSSLARDIEQIGAGEAGAAANRAYPGGSWSSR